MPRSRAHAELKNVPGGRCDIEERLGISLMGRPHVTEYNDPALAFRLEQCLWELKMGEDGPFELFLWGELLPVYEELLDLGRPGLDEEGLVFLLLNALPGCWRRFVEALVAEGLDTLSLVDVLDRIFLAEALEWGMDDGAELVCPVSIKSSGRIPSRSGKVAKRKMPRLRPGEKFEYVPGGRS